MQKNRIELAGYLAAKPEVRYLPSGTPVANARLAEGYRYKDRNEQVQEHTTCQKSRSASTRATTYSLKEPCRPGSSHPATEAKELFTKLSPGQHIRSSD